MWWDLSLEADKVFSQCTEQGVLWTEQWYSMCTRTLVCTLFQSHSHSQHSKSNSVEWIKKKSNQTWIKTNTFQFSKLWITHWENICLGTVSRLSHVWNALSLCLYDVITNICSQQPAQAVTTKWRKCMGENEKLQQFDCLREAFKKNCFGIKRTPQHRAVSIMKRGL